MYTPYAPRRLAALGERSHGGFRLKTYSIVFGADSFDAARFAGGLASAETALPAPAESGGRPGAGFLILHQGRTGDYLILGWWDNENELPLRVFVRDAAGWRAATGGESLCVWDLAVVWHEREAYVNTVMSGKSVADYLAVTFDGWV